jgi:hypothetical protein
MHSDIPYLPIMEYVYSHTMPVCWLVNESMLCATLNTDFHGFSRSEVLEILLKLLDEGLIYISDYDDHTIPIDAAAIERYFDQAANPDDNTAWYGLTLKGGEFWEQASAFDWDTYSEEGYGDPDDYTGEITTSSKAYTQDILLNLPNINILPEIVTWSVVSPWQATYWKELPLGHRVTFSYRVNKVEEDEDE